MILYDRSLYESYQFYHWFLHPDISLKEYINRQQVSLRADEEEVYKKINNKYIRCCKYAFSPTILYYNELSEYIYDHNKQIRPLDEYIFFKLRYYARKYIVIQNENLNFFEAERRKFKRNNYPEGIILLSESDFHDLRASFKYEGKILQMILDPGGNEAIFEFHGVENWKENQFLKSKHKMIIGELYEQSTGVFVYHTLWNHDNVDGDNYSDLSICFTRVEKQKYF